MKHTSKNLLLVAAASVTALTASAALADTTLFTDNYNSANNASVSAGIGVTGRQTGVFATDGYTETATHTIAGSTLVAGSATDLLATNVDFETALKDSSTTGFTVSFDAANTGASNWVSPYLSTHPGDERAQSQFGLRMHGNGTVWAHGTIGGANAVSRTDAQLDALLGAFDVTALNSYALVATTTTTTTGTYDVLINGTEVMSNIAYSLGSGGDDGEINWEEIHPGTTSATLDNLSISTTSATTTIYSDNFNSADNGSVSAGINDAGRQSGLLATDSYTETANHSIVGGQLSTGTVISLIAADADFTGALTDPLIDQFTLSFDAANTGNNWISPYLSTHNAADERGNSEFGLLINNNGDMTAYATGANQSITDAAIDAILGVDFDVSQMNSYALVADVDAGTYDLLINGTEVLSDVPYTIGAGGSNGEVNWEEIHPATSSAPTFDNLLLTTATFATAVPEPSSFALAALGFAGLFGTRRRRRR